MIAMIAFTHPSACIQLTFYAALRFLSRGGFSIEESDKNYSIVRRDNSKKLCLHCAELNLEFHR